MSLVVIKECETYDVSLLMEKINAGMELLGGWEQFIKPGMTVLLKVNLIGPKTSDSAAVTHSEFVRAITKILKEKGCIVWIGDSSGGAIAGIAPTTESMKIAGYEKVAKEEAAVIKNFDKEGVVEVIPESNPNEKMYLAKPIFEADLVINLPKLKTHTAGIYTGAVKNVFGCIPGLRKAYYHKIAPNPESFGEVIVDIHKAAKFPLHIMDGITAMEGEGPTAGQAYEANKILISTDPLGLDLVAAKMLDLSLDDIPILAAAKRRGLGEGKEENIRNGGDFGTIPTLKGFKLPKKYRSKKPSNYKALIKVIDFLKTRPVINMKKCRNCNMCVESCPVQAIDQRNKTIDYKACIECMCCHELCMQQAVILKKDNIFANIITKLFRGHYR